MPTDASEQQSIEKRLNELRPLITEMGDRADSLRAKTAGALGGGVFTLLLALGGVYDLATGNASVQIGLGVSKSMFTFITIALTVLSLALLAIAMLRLRPGNRGLESKLDELEEEFAQLLERKKSLADLEE